MIVRILPENQCLGDLASGHACNDAIGPGATDTVRFAGDWSSVTCGV